jgi:hypothetical protein
MARKGTGRQKHLADMSLPPAERRRRSGGRAPVPVPAQMQHGLSPAGRRKSRDGERRMDQDRAARP